MKVRSVLGPFVTPALFTAFLVVMGIRMAKNSQQPNYSLSAGRVAWNQLWDREFKFPHSKFSD